MCCKESTDFEKQMKVAQFAANMARVDAKTAKKEASKFETEYVAKVKRRADEIGKSTMQLRQQIVSAAAWWDEQAFVFTELESRNRNADSLEEALTVSPNEFADKKL